MDEINFSRVVGDGTPYYISDDGKWVIRRVSRNGWNLTSDLVVSQDFRTFTDARDYVQTWLLQSSVKASAPQEVDDSATYDLQSLVAAAEDVQNARRVLDAAERDLHWRVQDARLSQVSWTIIGLHVGLSKQGAQQRFGSKR